MRLIDLEGERYGRLTVIERKENIGMRSAWLCKCDCGNTIITTSNSLRRGYTQSCGCLKKERAALQSKNAGLKRGIQMRKHGDANTRLYKVWKSMRQRCNNEKNKDYKDYGGRGIKICDEWDDYSNFKSWALANGYDSNFAFGECTIDRIDVNRNYEPSNCRWADFKTQANNRRPRKRKDEVNENH